MASKDDIRHMKMALKYAAKGIGKVVFVGKEEVAKGEFKVKDMISGDEKFLDVEGIIGLF